MRTIGLIGGMSWESSAEYYRLINQQVRDRLGPLRSARLLMYSVDFGPVEQAQHAGRWDQAAAILVDAALRLQDGGAECVVLCTNTMHKVAQQIQAAISVPFLHIADPTAQAAVDAGTLHVGLLGTGFTMEENFLKERLAQRGLSVLVPDEQQRQGDANRRRAAALSMDKKGQEQQVTHAGRRIQRADRGQHAKATAGVSSGRSGLAGPGDNNGWQQGRQCKRHRHTKRSHQAQYGSPGEQRQQHRHERRQYRFAEIA